MSASCSLNSSLILSMSSLVSWLASFPSPGLAAFPFSAFPSDFSLFSGLVSVLPGDLDFFSPFSFCLSWVLSSFADCCFCESFCCSFDASFDASFSAASSFAWLLLDYSGYSSFFDPQNWRCGTAMNDFRCICLYASLAVASREVARTIVSIARSLLDCIFCFGIKIVNL